MCGIAGIVALAGAPPEPDRLRAMCGVIGHRGPDDEAFDIRCGVGLGVRRLAIIDIQGGRQPYFNEGGTVRAVFNGEIYNFRELRRELEARGHEFASGTDGEVIVHLWEDFGPGFPSRLNGMFAVALHDAHQRRFLLVRDRIGIKPLFYLLTAQHLIFGSEVKALLASELVGRALDPTALGELLAWEYVPAPRTLFAGIRKLEPGSLLELDLDTGQDRQRIWWEIPGDGDRGSEPRDAPHEEGATSTRASGWAEEVDAKLRQAVQRQLVSDVPLGAFLSGGVDSSLVVAGMGRARAFSIGFDDPTYNELRWAERVAAHLGAEHTVEVLRPKALELFEHLMHYLDDPIGDFSIFPTYLVSRLAADHVRVVLTGDGGDELFGGYETYLAHDLARLWNRIPRFLRNAVLERTVRAFRPRPAKKGRVNAAKRFVEGLGHPAVLEHARWRLFVGEELRRQLLTPEVEAARETPAEAHIERLFAAAGSRSGLLRQLYVDVRSYLADNCLVKVDRMSMACSLEARVPFLDHEMVELAFRVPAKLKIRRGQTKILLKRIAARHVPRECVYRPKEGFSIPIKNWLAGPLKPLMDELLAPERIRAEGLFRTDTVTRLRREHLAGVANHSHVLWTLLVLQDWRRRWSV
ncbi:MAG: asparagine synthase (glutamine-hydrolyzing) [Gemmatimonadota bacterium]